MDKVSKSLEVLKLLSSSSIDPSTPSNERPRPDPISTNKDKLHHLNNIVELLISPSLNKNNNENYVKLFTSAFEILFLYCDETDHDIRLAAEENLNKLIKSLKETQTVRIQLELHRTIKRNPNIGPRALKGALWRFALFTTFIQGKKIRVYFEHLFPVFCSIANRNEETLHEKLPDAYDLIFRVLGRSMNDQETKEIFSCYLPNLSHESALIRRSSASCLIIFCRYSRHPLVAARFLLSNSIDQFMENFRVDANYRLIVGHFGLIKNLIQFLGLQLEELTSKYVDQSSTKSVETNEQNSPIQLRHLVEVSEFHLTLPT